VCAACCIPHGGALERPIGIYASSLSRRDLARRRARMRPPLVQRAGTWAATGGLVALVGLLAEQLAG
jgi:hypothetical protein